MSTLGDRAKFVWLALVGVLVLILSLASVSGSAGISPVVALGLVMAYLAAAYVMVRGVDLNAFRRTVQTTSQTVKMTGAARQATQKARLRPEYGMGSDHALVDIGMLVNEKRRDGRWDRRIAEGGISYDDGAIQPYIKIRVAPEMAGRVALIEFEFYDRSGKLQFTQRMEEYLRDGENLILCDRQLPLRDSTERGRAGTWDLRVKVDSSLVGIHEFNMAAAGETRTAATSAPNMARSRNVLSIEDEETPVSLEDLLREQARRSKSAE